MEFVKDEEEPGPIFNISIQNNDFLKCEKVVLPTIQVAPPNSPAFQSDISESNSDEKINIEHIPKNCSNSNNLCRSRGVKYVLK